MNEHRKRALLYAQGTIMGLLLAILFVAWLMGWMR